MGGIVNDHSHHEQEILLLDAAAAADESSPDFGTLLEVFGLPPAYRRILIRVLRAGSWRDSDSPIDAVWRETMRAIPGRETMRAAAKRDNEGRHRREVNGGYSADRLGWLDHMAQTSLIREKKVRGGDKSGITTGGDKPGIWRQGGGRDAADERAIDAAWALLGKPLSMESLPPELRDWNKIAERAGLDCWETKALQCMALGLSRYASLKALEVAADRRALEAAWRRLERSNFYKVREILVRT
jgi:hypothetical protein